MNKEELVARLTELGKQLNREVILTGSKEDLALRITELEEELGDNTESSTLTPYNKDHPFDGGDNFQTQVNGNNTTEKQSAAGLVEVKTLTTVHIDAFHQFNEEILTIVPPGVIIRISQQDADGLIKQGIVSSYK